MLFLKRNFHLVSSHHLAHIHCKRNYDILHVLFGHIKKLSTRYVIMKLTDEFVLPPELECYIFSFLSPKDLCNAMAVCKRWQEIIRLYPKLLNVGLESYCEQTLNMMEISIPDYIHRIPGNELIKTAIYMNKRKEQLQKTLPSTFFSRAPRELVHHLPTCLGKIFNPAFCSFPIVVFVLICLALILGLKIAIVLGVGIPLMALPALIRTAKNIVAFISCIKGLVSHEKQELKSLIEIDIESGKFLNETPNEETPLLPRKT